MAVARKLYLENLRVGDELPTAVRAPIDRMQVFRYCAAANDFHPLSIDDQAARELRMPGICANGMLPMGYMGQFLQDWLKGGRLIRFATRFMKLIWPGDSICCKGRILARRRDEQGRYLVDLDIWAENQKGEMVMKGHATGQLYFNTEDEARQKRGETPLVADVSERTEMPRNPKPRAPLRPAAELDRDEDGDFEDDELEDDEDERPAAKEKAAKAASKAPAKPVKKAARG